jgi:hypothetical protein
MTEKPARFFLNKTSCLWLWQFIYQWNFAVFLPFTRNSNIDMTITNSPLFTHHSKLAKIYMSNIVSRSSLIANHEGTWLTIEDEWWTNYDMPTSKIDSCSYLWIIYHRGYCSCKPGCVSNQNCKFKAILHKIRFCQLSNSVVCVWEN